MKIDTNRVRQRLAEGDLPRLFVEELGWDRHALDEPLDHDGQRFTLAGIAEKRGVQVLVCRPAPGEPLPNYTTRQWIERRVRKLAHEHLLVFADDETQVWQWVSREPDQPARYREIRFTPGQQSGERLLDRLHEIAFAVSEEESIDLLEVTTRLRDSVPRDKVTKKFFKRFEQEHASFLKFVKGIKDQGDKEWYASLMLNRLMFVYFIQKKGFLDGDRDYLQNRLERVRQRKGRGRFHRFYRFFLLALFHEGFAKQPGDRELDDEHRELLGAVPYLNGGLFDVHDLERKYDAKIDVPDEAFEQLFAFFDEWRWHLDDRPLRNDKQINPDVLGYIFEKYINNKQMGAYYTKEDITDYIGRNTILPYLLDAARDRCHVAFEPGSALWRLLRDDPDTYIYPAMRKGVIDAAGEVIPLPAEIAAGIDDVSKRIGWNRAADDAFALPTETWREHVARRQRCLEIRERLRSGAVHDANDLITLNLDIRQFMQDVIATCEGPDLLRAIYYSIAGRVAELPDEERIPGITILDPTCGSGAFLFAALHILEPLYDECLKRMEEFVRDASRDTPCTPVEQVEALIACGESQELEFKATARWDVREKQANKKMQDIVVKTVAAMLNSTGGDLLIGIDDDGGTCGIEPDYRLMGRKGNRDGYELWLTDLLLGQFGRPVSPSLRVTFVSRDGRDVCRVSVSPGRTATYVTEGNDERIYIRTGNSSRALTTREAVEYISHRFGDSEQITTTVPVEDSQRTVAPRFPDFRRVLADVAAHPSRDYFVLKSIIVHNLYGVDIMEEAVEICKLRLFLTLVSRVEPRTDVENQGLEPLPDIDFNIRTGNTLVGFATLDDVRNSITGERVGGSTQNLLVDSELEETVASIKADAEGVDEAFQRFHSMQTTHALDAVEFAETKTDLRTQLAALTDRLDEFLAEEYGVDPQKPRLYADWRKSHQPFHWFAEFFGIMEREGFDVVIGNPPYVELREIDEYGWRGFTCEAAGNLYALVMEKCDRLVTTRGRQGYIVPVSSISTDRYEPLQQLIARRRWWCSAYDDRPSRLFEGIEHIRLTIHLLSERLPDPSRFTSRYNKWNAEERANLFSVLQLTASPSSLVPNAIPKVSHVCELSLVDKLRAQGHRLREFTVARSPRSIHYSRKVGYFMQVLDFMPRVLDGNGSPRPPSEFKTLAFREESHERLALACLNSSLFYWFVTVFSDCRHLNKREVDSFPIDLESLSDSPAGAALIPLSHELMDDIQSNSEERVMKFRHDTLTVQCILPRTSKPIMDRIDGVLGQHYGLNPVELDFVTQYDSKYRTGVDE